MLKKLVVSVTALSTTVAACHPVPAFAAPACHAVEGADVTVCISTTSNGSTQKGRVFDGETDKFGVVSFGISVTDEDCAKDRRGQRPIRKNCKKGGKVGPDFITPFYSYSDPNWAICGVEQLTSAGCGGRALKEGLMYVVGFDSARGMFAVHRGPGGSLGESHGCVRGSGTVAEWIYDQYAAGKTVALVHLDNRPAG